MQSSTPFENDHWRYASYEHNSTSNFQQAVGSNADCCFCDSEECGSGAASSSKIYNNHDQTQSENSIPFHQGDTCTDSSSISLNSIESILTSVESMFKPSLIDLAKSHGVKIHKKMSSEELKNVISDHLNNGFCLSSMFEGCTQVASVLTKNKGRRN
jgi:galactitol-specific phosphotransferase system IIB component